MAQNLRVKGGRCCRKVSWKIIKMKRWVRKEGGNKKERELGCLGDRDLLSVSFRTGLHALWALTLSGPPGHPVHQGSQ